MVEGSVHHRRLAALIVADVVGFSRMMEADEAGTLGLLKRRRKNVLEPVVRSHRGRIVKLLGDGVLLEFLSAIAAVECAIQLQKRMSEANGDAPELECVVLRIGINLGDVLGEGSDVYGEGVNIAARLEAIAPPGGICVSEKVYHEVRGKVDATFVDLGPRKLKNISVPVRIFSVASEARSGNTVHPGASEHSREFTAIAVLPLTNMSGRKDRDYFADGITEDLITELSRIRNLSIVARNTTFTYKDRAVDVPEVGRQLGADFVVEGSIQMAGNRVRVPCNW
jgi:class 3 adenylate cyclase